MKCLFNLLATALLLISCTQTGITGSWVQPIPGQEANTQGFKLDEGGKASSINMHTLQYESWEQQNNLLILNGLSMGNGQTIAFSDTLRIESLTPDSLILKRGDYPMRYARQ